ncbi:MAG: nitronate monooxygenase, partial [Pseudolabrys sp.]
MARRDSVPAMWLDERALDLFKVEHPVVLAPMAGAMETGVAIAVAEAGALGSLPIAMLDERQMRDHMAKFRAATDKPVNLNFFCHKPAV